ncbi:hypothetical protein J6590_063433 [Homalodisca vitripennis]|nr:hypothetical protein J6590_063433 [Homalodisca vitripennis]
MNEGAGDEVVQSSTQESRVVALSLSAVDKAEHSGDAVGWRSMQQFSMVPESAVSLALLSRYDMIYCGGPSPSKVGNGMIWSSVLDANDVSIQFDAGCPSGGGEEVVKTSEVDAHQLHISMRTG